MNELSDNFDLLENQVNKLIQVKQDLTAELKKCRIERDKAQDQMKSLKDEVEELKEKNKILRIAGGTDQEGNREVKLKINEIVREVDKCIAQLNQ